MPSQTPTEAGGICIPGAGGMVLAFFLLGAGQERLLHTAAAPPKAGQSAAARLHLSCGPLPCVALCGSCCIGRSCSGSARASTSCNAAAPCHAVAQPVQGLVLQELQVACRQRSSRSSSDTVAAHTQVLPACCIESPLVMHSAQADSVSHWLSPGWPWQPLPTCEHHPGALVCRADHHGRAPEPSPPRIHCGTVVQGGGAADVGGHGHTLACSSCCWVRPDAGGTQLELYGADHADGARTAAGACMQPNRVAFGPTVVLQSSRVVA